MDSLTFPQPITYISKIEVNSTDKNASGFYDQLNQSHYDALLQFKEALTKDNIIQDFVTYDDLYLLRFLRARKFNLEKAMLMYKNFLDWREKEHVDALRENYSFTEMLDVKKYYPHSYHKTDKTGRPIYIELLSKVNLTELFKVTTDERMTKYYVREYERLMKRRFPACSAVMKKSIEQSLTILDIEGIGVTALVGRTKPFVQLAITIGQDYYPEILGNMYILNNGYFFSAAWAIIKNFMDDKTTKKIQMLGSKYQEKLLEFIDEDSLPEFLGGKCTCSGIEGGCLYSDIGPWNPKGGISI